MDPYDFSALRRELVYQEFMIHYLQEEQKKRWEELRAIEQDLEKLQADPKYQQLVKLVEKMKNEPVAEQVRARRSRAKRATRAAVRFPTVIMWMQKGYSSRNRSHSIFLQGIRTGLSKGSLRRSSSERCNPHQRNTMIPVFSSAG